MQLPGPLCPALPRSGCRLPMNSLLLMLPTGIVALVMLLTGAEGGIWLAIIPVALANGIGILALGTWLGGKLMDARMLSIVAALDSFASLQK